MKLKTPSAPFSPVFVTGESISIDTTGKVLVLPTGNDTLPLFNEKTLNSNRLTIAESPFGGLKGSGSPDYAVGTVSTATDGVYLTDLSGTNSTKTMSAGKLKGLGLLSVDTVNHTVTEEFIIRNDNSGTDVQVIDACDAITNFSMLAGTGTLSIENGRLKVTGTADGSGNFQVKNVSVANLSTKNFLCVQLETSVSSVAYLKIASDSNGLKRKVWNDVNRFPLNTSVAKQFILPIKASQGMTGSLPSYDSGDIDLSNVIYFVFGVTGLAASQNITIYIDNITACNGTSAQVEVAAPDNLSATSLALFTHNGTSYQLASTHSLDSVYSQVSQTSANFTALDSTKFDDVYGTGLGRAVFPKGSVGETKTGSSGTIIYSGNKGTSQRIGLKVNLPPSDDGRTNFNKCRMKLVLNYATDSNGVRSTSYDFDNSSNTSYGLQNLVKPWIALYDPASNLLDFYLFTHRPKNLNFKRDESGQIYELTLFPGNGMIYHGQITHCNLTADDNANSIPNCLESSVEGSLTKFLQAYGMVI